MIHLTQLRPLLMVLTFIGGIANGADDTIATEPLFWPHKNGPTQDGIVPAVDAAKLPTRWDGGAGTHIVWRTPLNDEGHSTPVIGGDLIWITCATPDGRKQWVRAYHRKDGKLIHDLLLFENADPEPLGNPLNNYAAPSCVLEADAVYAHFGTYGTARIDPTSGRIIWQRRDINARHFRGPGSSPLLFENFLILTFDGIDRQFVIALEKDTGKTVWETPRSTDFKDLNPDGKPKADGDLRKAYHTPTVFTIKGTPHLVSIGSRAAFGYNPRTGQEIWTLPHDGFNAAISALKHQDILLLNSGSERSHTLALRIDDQMKGDLTATHLVWKRDKRNASEANPVLIDGRLIQITRGGILTSVDVLTGEEVAETRLAGQHLASPIAAGDRLYFSNDRGTTFVVRAGTSFDVLAENPIGDPISASPAVAEGDLYLRTKAALYRIQSGAE